MPRTYEQLETDYYAALRDLSACRRELESRAQAQPGEVEAVLREMESVGGGGASAYNVARWAKRLRASAAPAPEPVAEYAVSESGLRGIVWRRDIPLPAAQGYLYAAPHPDSDLEKHK